MLLTCNISLTAGNSTTPASAAAVIPAAAKRPKAESAAFPPGRGEPAARPATKYKTENMHSIYPM